MFELFSCFEYQINKKGKFSVGLDTEKRIVSEKMRKDAKRA